MVKSILDKNSPVESMSSMGGKAQNLYLIESQGVVVPKWCCISCEEYSSNFKEIKPQIIKLLENIDLSNLDQIKQISKKIEELFLQLEINKDLIEQIQSYFPSTSFFAIRSSAVGEDGYGNSFAGQLSTYLFVRNYEISEKIKKCWASSFSERVIQYNALNKKDYDSLKVAVIIQKMIDSEKSGVLFTVNPLMGEDYNNQAIITAGYGVGEGIVADIVEIDTYVYDRIKKNIVKSEYSEKKIKLVMGENGGLQQEEVEHSKSKASVLTHENITQLVSIATSLFKFYGHEVDMEWAYDKSGNLFITQARPITTLNKSFAGKDILLDNSNVVESFPGINTPWTLSIITDVYKTVFTNATLRVGLSKKAVEEKSYVFNHLIATYQGRVFYNLTNWYEMMRLAPYTEKYIEVWEQMLDVEQNQLSKQKKHWSQNIFFNPIRFILIIKRVLWLFIRLDSKLSLLDKKLVNDFDHIWRKDKKGIYLGYSPGDFMLEIEQFKQQVFKNWDITLINDIYAFVCTAISKNLLKRLKIKDVDNFFNDLLFGISGMESVAPVKSLVKMGILVKEDESLKSKIEGLVKSGQASVNVLTHTQNELNFRQLFQYHLAEYGDRGVEELKLETLTFREDPNSLLKMIIEYSKANIESLNKGEDNKRRVIATKILNQKLLTRPILKIILPFFLKMAVRSINYRENFRLHRSRAYGIVRRLTNYLGLKLESLGLIDHSRDIYYLDYDEVFKFTHALSFNSQLKGLINERKSIYETYKNLHTEQRYKFNGKDYCSFEIDSDSILESDLSGQPCSSGAIEGEVLVIDDIEELNKDAGIGKGKILVAPMTDPGWVFLMTVSKGLIVEKGSILSHTAIIGRELGIPTIVGVKSATKMLKTGDKIKMDGQTGKITIIKE